MTALTDKLKIVLLSVLPIFFLVIIINFAIVPLASYLLIRFVIGTLLIIIGLVLFLLGVDLGITPLGNYVGEKIVKTNKLWVIILSGLILGFVITIAEPGLLVYAQQISILTGDRIPSTLLLFVVSSGLATLLVAGFLRIIYNVPLHILLTILYLIVFILAFFTQPELLVIAFDAAGATTGVLAVPFILSLAYGMSHLKKDSKGGEKDSFGTIAIVSAGAIISVLLLSVLSSDIIFIGTTITHHFENIGILKLLGSSFPMAFRDTFFALLPIIVILFIAQFVFFKMRANEFIHMVKGFIYVFVGLLVFLLGVNGGFTDVAVLIGRELVATQQYFWLLIIAFIIGVTIVLAEPAVHVLTHQIEEITSGYVSRIAVLIALSIGVGIAVTLSALRIFIEPLQIWHYLLPGYIIAIALMYVVPKIFVGIAYDAGGVATGPMTATFVLAFMYGATDAFEGANIILDGLGTIAMVALTPIITLQCLGLIFKLKSRKGGL